MDCVFQSYNSPIQTSAKDTTDFITNKVVVDEVQRLVQKIFEKGTIDTVSARNKAQNVLCALVQDVPTLVEKMHIDVERLNC